MSLAIRVSEVIDRPVAEVFRVHALEHVKNHPRWDPYMHLEQVSDGPIGAGTLIKRVNSRSGSPVEGTMEIVEFEPTQAMGMVIHDGPLEMKGRATYEPFSGDRTTLTLDIEFPGMDASMDASLLTNQMQRALRNIKQFIESETPAA